MQDGNLELSETLRLLKEKGNPPPADQLRRLWEIPERVPDDFRIPKDARLALASGSDEKRKLVTAVWNELGGKGIIITDTVDEELGKKFLSDRHRFKDKANDDRNTPDPFRVTNIATLKASEADDALLARHGATHVMGLDIDVTPWASDAPLGTPQSTDELKQNLVKMQNKTIMVNIAGTVRVVGSGQSTSEVVHINIPVGEFDIDKYVEEHGNAVVGRVAGGIDFTDSRCVEYLGPGTITVERELHFSPHFAPETQLFRTVGVYGDQRGELLAQMEDYFKGAPKEMVKWMIYDAFRPDQNIA